MANLVIKIEGELPKRCFDCPLSETDLDAYANWCAVSNKEIKNGNKKLRGCPIKGTVREKDIIKEKEDGHTD